MRRQLATFVALALVAAACSGGGDGADDTTPPASSAPEANESEEQADDDVDAATVDADVDTEPADESEPDPPTAASRPDGPPLPGLLDTSDEVLADDARVRTGELSNGLRYYIRENDNPGGKADLRLAVRAGSVDEFGPSTGTAHFVEHMLFNGTAQFPENELIDVLRSFGASFGPDVNAYTSYDETVYSLVVPNDERTIELGLEVLSEWLQAATFDADQVVAERGVVLDEWRIRTQTTGGRLFEIASEMYLGGSAYDGRAPIGTADSIEAMEAAELRAYYDGWYRPDNVAIVAVGEFDIDDMEADIQRLFGDAAARTDAMPDRPDTAFDLVSEPDFRLHADPDQRTVDVEVTLPLPAHEGTGTAADRVRMLDFLIFDILVTRLAGDVAAGTAPFDDVSPGTNSFVDGLDAPALYAFTDVRRVRDTLQALLDEYQRTWSNGFTDDELGTARDRYRSFLDTEYEGRDSTQDRVYADELVEHFLRGAPYPAIANGYAVAVAELDAVTTAALAERFAARWANTWPHVIISVPEVDAAAMPDRDEVIDTILATYGRDVAERAELRDLPDELMAAPEPAEPGRPRRLTNEGFSLFDPIVFRFDNGVQVALNPNPIVTGRLFFFAASPGGSSLVADDDVVDALYAAEIVTSSGVAGFNQAELAQIIAGADVELGAFIEPYVEGMSGSTATSDVETLLQLVHLYMTEPRFGPVALQQLVAAEGPVVADPSTSPSAAGSDALRDTRYDGELRYTVLPSPAEFDTLDLAGVERVWKQRFGDAGDWVFAFSGDFDVDEMVDLTSRYLGTLPGTGTVEASIDVEPPPPTSVETVDVVAGAGDTGSVTMLFTSPVPSIDATDRALTDVTSALLGARLDSVIRERFGETYSPFAGVFFSSDPDPVIETIVQVTGAPDRLGDIADLVVAELDGLRTQPLTADEFGAAYAEIEEQYNFVDNGQFLDAIIDDLIDPNLPVESYLGEYFALFDIDDDDVSAFIVDHIDTGAYVRVTVTPR